jgi:hypothetical protein
MLLLREVLLSVVRPSRLAVRVFVCLALLSRRVALLQAGVRVEQATLEQPRRHSHSNTASALQQLRRPRQAGSTRLSA